MCFLCLLGLFEIGLQGLHQSGKKFRKQKEKNPIILTKIKVNVKIQK